MSYSSGDIIEIRIKDFTNKCYGKYRLDTNDKKNCAKILEYLRQKYNIPSEIADDVNWNSFNTEVFC